MSDDLNLVSELAMVLSRHSVNIFAVGDVGDVLEKYALCDSKVFVRLYYDEHK